MKLSIVVPCYNEREVIATTAGRLSTLAREWLAGDALQDYEIIYVDDGSSDGTLDILTALAERDSQVKVIAFSRNFGHQAALTAGLMHASGDAAVSLDADLQDPPEIIAQMIARHAEGFDVVYGVRQDRRQDSFFKRHSAESFYKLMRLMGVRLVFNHADFRLLSRKALDALRAYPETNRFIRGLIPMLGFRQCEVAYTRAGRVAGETKYPLRRMLSFALEGITSFSYVPLRIASVLGGIIFLCTLVLMGWALGTRLFGNAAPGWASTVLPLYFLGGIQLIFLGVIGEYLGKIYLEVKRRPLFIVKEKHNFPE